MNEVLRILQNMIPHKHETFQNSENFRMKSECFGKGLAPAALPDRRPRRHQGQTRLGVRLRHGRHSGGIRHLHEGSAQTRARRKGVM